MSLSAALCLLVSPIFSNNGGNENADPDANLAQEQRLEELQLKADVIIAELQVLKEAKQASSSSQEKKVIRKRAKELKGELNAVYAEGQSYAKGQRVTGGVYIGSTAIIVILLLLLLL
ncbi:MAG: hypothetical protein IPL46_17405 [Saprospiraceae bacterium]|nr:hypothetical protein [Saprospiraceae bacterium]